MLSKFLFTNIAPLMMVKYILVNVDFLFIDATVFHF